MGVFDHFPYTNLHELNLSWIIAALKAMEQELENFVAANAIKYADPIQWNITTQYEKNTVVIDPQTGIAYLSVAAVPSGIAISNQDYWTVIFDLSSFVVKTAKNFTSNYEEESTLTATFNTTANDWLIWGDTLYYTLTNINAGDQYVIGTNIAPFTLEDTIGHLQDLNTTDRSSIVAAINDLYSSLNIPTLADLLARDYLQAGAVVETQGYYAPGDGGGATYEILSSATPDGIYTYTMTNGLYAHIVTNDTVNILQLGAHSDGSVDDTAIIQAAVDNDHEVIIPEGEYIISAPIIPARGCTISSICTSFNREYATLKTNDDITMMRFYNYDITVKDIEFKHEDSNTSPVLDFTASRYIQLKNVKLTHPGSASCYGLYSDPNSVDWCGYITLDTVYASSYDVDVYINPTLMNCLNCKFNGSTNENLHFATGSEIISLVGCDLRNDNKQPIIYDGIYGVALTGCYIEHMNMSNFFKKTDRNAYVKNLGNKLTYSVTPNSYGAGSYEAIFTKDTADPSVIPGFKNGYDGDNILMNGDFSFDTLGWIITDPGVTAVVQNCSGDIGYDKELYAEFTSGSNIHQDLGNLPEGEYTLSFWVMAEDIVGTYYFDAYVCFGSSPSPTNYYAHLPLRDLGPTALENGVWKFVTMNFTSTNDPNFSNLYARIRCNNTVPKLHIAGVCLTPGRNAKNINQDSSGRNRVLAKALYLKGSDNITYKIDVSGGVISATSV